MIVKWYGDEVFGRVLAAALAGTEEAARQAAAHAAANHPWQSETGAEEQGIVAYPPEMHGLEVVAQWFAPSPALYLEFGTSRMPAFPFLRPAADATYSHALLTTMSSRL